MEGAVSLYNKEGAWFNSNFIKTLENDPDEVTRLFNKRASGQTYLEIIQDYRVLSQSEDKYKMGRTNHLLLSDWLSNNYPDDWLIAEKAWGYTLFETAKAGVLTKLRDRKVTETLTNYDEEGEVIGMQTREKFIPADSKFVQKVLEVYDPEHWDRKTHLAAKLDERKLEIQDAAMKQGKLSEDQADEFKTMIDALTISANSIDPKAGKSIERGFNRSKVTYAKDAEIIEEDL